MEMFNDLCPTCLNGSFDNCKTDFEKIQLDDITRNVVMCENYREKPKHHLKITYECGDKIATEEKDVYELPDVKWKKAGGGIGEFSNVMISPEDLEKLKMKYPNYYEDAVEALSRYIEIEPKKTKRYKNHYAVLCQWITREIKKDKAHEKEVSEQEKSAEINVCFENLESLKKIYPNFDWDSYEEDDFKLRNVGLKHGKGVVFLSIVQQDILLDEMDDVNIYEYYIEMLADFIIKKNAKPKSHFKTIMKWYKSNFKV